VSVRKNQVILCFTPQKSPTSLIMLCQRSELLTSKVPAAGYGDSFRIARAWLLGRSTTYKATPPL